MLIEELLIGLGFDYDEKGLNKFKSGLKTATKAVTQFAKMAATSVTALGGIALVSSKASDEMGKYADEIGDAVENIDALQFSANRAGTPIQGLKRGLRDLAVRANEFARGEGSGKSSFEALGISVKNANGEMKGATDLFVEISKQMERLNKTQQIELADKLGLKKSIRLLQQGPEEIKKLMDEAKKLGVTTAEDAKLAAEFEDSLTGLWQVTKDLSRAIASALLPKMKEIVTSTTEWWKTNREVIKTELPKWIDRVVLSLKILIGLFAFAFASSIVAKITTIITALKVLFATIIAINFSMLLIPALITVAVAAIALLVNDIYHFFAGNESFIGDMLEKYPKWAGFIKNIGGLFSWIIDLVKMIWDGWSMIFDLIGDALGGAISGLSSAFEFVLGLVDQILEGWKLITEEIKKAYEGLVEDTTEVVHTVRQTLGLANDDVDINSAENEIRRMQSINRLVDQGTITREKAIEAIDKGITVNELKMEINSNSADAKQVANEVMNTFRQTTQDLQTTVDQ